jgi:hypothetical protein
MDRWLAVLVCLAACARASDEGEAKQWPSQPPPHDVTIPASLSIDVKVDGAAKPAITATTLGAAKPDFADSERKAWLIPSLVPDAAPAGSVVEAVAPGGFSVKFAHPTADGLEPVLFLTRRGDVMVAAVDPKDPFPRWHEKGGRLRRGGDPMPRVQPVARLEITRRSTP